MTRREILTTVFYLVAFAASALVVHLRVDIPAYLFLIWLANLAGGLLLTLAVTTAEEERKRNS